MAVKLKQTTMKKLIMVLAATVICGASLFTSCKKDEDNDLKLEEKIIGKWMVTDMNGKPLPSNEKTVYTFVSATKATVSTSINTHPEVGTHWNDRLDADVTIDDNKITLTDHPDETTTVVEEYIVTDISGTEFTANHKVVVTKDGIVVDNDNHVLRLVKVTADYSTAILGKWECQELTGIETFNDANARLEFFADGTYNYWRKNDAGEWEAVTNREFQNYFVDGTLLATRWKNTGEDELREWWEIASIANGQMQWTALRQNADGTTAQQGMKWVKVN